MPLLWVLPLSIYLLTFIIGFSNVSGRFSGLYACLLVVGLLAAWLILRNEKVFNIFLQIGGYSLALFAGCLFCHASLYRLRPSTRYLTHFYLLIATGGALGGIFVAMVAPVIFKGYWEYHAGLVLASVLLAWIVSREENRWIYRLRYLFFFLPFLLAILLKANISVVTKDIVEMSRNFYGTLRVHCQVKTKENRSVAVYALMHGNIPHGMQPDRSSYRFKPTVYYTEKSGVGLAILNHPARVRGEPIRMGVVGLGIGTLAAYGRPGDYIRFYEINPDVIRYANDNRFFTYLLDCKSDVDIVPGDGRLSLERELKQGLKQEMDILILDAFNGGAIPSHIVTEEAFDIYLRCLKPDGIIAWHATNRYIDFIPLAYAVAKRLGLRMAIVESVGDFVVSSDAMWILLARDDSILGCPAIEEARLKDISDKRAVKMWTDDFSNILALLKPGGPLHRKKQITERKQ